MLFCDVSALPMNMMSWYDPENPDYKKHCALYDIKGLANRLKEHHWSTDKLLEITKRLHEREIAAQGKGHVTASLYHDHTKFEKVTSGNLEELARVETLIDRLIDAAEVIDEEYMAEKRKAKEQKYLTHVELEVRIGS